MSTMTDIPQEDPVRATDLTDPIPVQHDLESEWMREVERRSAEIKAGQVACLTWEALREQTIRRLHVPN
ncbi:MAG: addiction module protein [Magnetococcales bacterium]|nr:addiction module protein [Magnetococcales bacterium]